MYRLLPTCQRFRAALACVAMVFSSQAFAVGEEMTMPTDPGGLPSNGDDFRIGIGGIETPAFIGSETQRKLLVPAFSATFNGEYYVGSSYTGVGGGVGMLLDKQPGFIWSVGVAGAQSRLQDWAPELQGMGDQHAALFVNSGMSWRTGAFHVSGGIATGLRGNEGSLARIEVGLSGPIAPHWIVGVGADALAVNRQQNNFDYGINDQQAATRAALIASGSSDLIPGEAGPYTAAGGIQRTGYGVFVAYAFDKHWSLAGFWGQAQLQGSAEDSPLVRTHTGDSFGLFLSYRFSTAEAQ